MLNEKERKRRSELLGKLNKTDAFKKKASDTAIKTSARKDIQESRAKVLKKWRDENPDKFNEIVQKFCNTYKSKPEITLFNLVSNKYPQFCFKNNGFINSNVFKNKTRRKQIDIISKDKKIIIEFDGARHFKEIANKGVDPKEKLEHIKLMDHSLHELVKNNYIIIRVSPSEWKNGFFTKECIDSIDFILANGSNGIYIR